MARSPSRLYPILDAAFVREQAMAVQALSVFSRAGVGLVQLRAKDLGAGAFLEWAEPLVEEGRKRGLSVLINDRADVAKATGAAGVHLGQEDPSPRTVRRLLGDGAVIGLSTHSVDQARAAAAEPVDYIAIGPVFATRTKASENPTLGPAGVKAVREHVSASRPLVAIGGITLTNAGQVFAAGASSVCVISALWNDERPLGAVVAEWMSLR